MFKNYLTYSFAIDFHRLCTLHSALGSAHRDQLLASAKKMVAHFSRSVEAKTRPEEARNLAVAILCLRDCRQLLDETDSWTDELRACHRVLNRRLELLIGEAAAILARTEPSNLADHSA